MIIWLTAIICLASRGKGDETFTLIKIRHPYPMRYVNFDVFALKIGRFYTGIVTLDISFCRTPALIKESNGARMQWDRVPRRNTNQTSSIPWLGKIWLVAGTVVAITGEFLE